jgi:hypothetical protein
VAVAFELDGELVGTVRAVPIGHGLTLAEKLRYQAGLAPGDTYDGGWEMGRLAISPEYRGGPESLRGFLFLSLTFLHGLSPVGSLHATCTPALARLYRRFGFSVVARDVPLLGTRKTYTLIHGYFERVIAELAESEALSTADIAAGSRFGAPGSRSTSTSPSTRIGAFA